MYGVVEIAGHQYRVGAGEILDVDKLNAEEGSNIDLDQVLFIGGDSILVGAPTIQGALIKAKVIKHARDRKILVLKRKPGRYQKRMGHRRHYTSLLITEITDGKGNKMAIDPESKTAKKYLTA